MQNVVSFRTFSSVGLPWWAHIFPTNYVPVLILRCRSSSLICPSKTTVWYYIICYSCNKITTIQIEIPPQNWNGFFSNICHQMMIWSTPIVSTAKNKWYKLKKVKKLALNLQLLNVQILKKDVRVLILCLSYFITTVLRQLICFSI